MKQGFLVGGMMIVLLGNAGCTIQPKRTALHDFGLEQAHSVQKKTAMMSVEAPTWLWDNRIRYRLLYLAATQVRFYGLDLWIASPPELFEQYLLNNGSATAYPLVIRITDFEQQFDSPDQARVVLRFSVDAYSPDHQHKLGTQSVNLEQRTKTPDAKGAIDGFAQLIRLAALTIKDWSVGLNPRIAD
ncbi:MAG: hypothetical protein NTV00_05990 [Methylococcales bacterium]|nr:hypothetical protein [Methylococcales bacterium]